MLCSQLIPPIVQLSAAAIASMINCDCAEGFGGAVIDHPQIKLEEDRNYGKIDPVTGATRHTGSITRQHNQFTSSTDGIA
jgi:hypothetical protein